MNYLESKTPTSLSSSSSLKYENRELQQKINENKNESELNWGGENLTDDDMAIVAFYLLQNNKVSSVVFGFSLLKRKI